MPRVVVPPPYRGPTGGLSEIQVAGASVGACLEEAAAAHPGLGELILAGDGSIHHFVNVFLNGEKLAREAALETPVQPEDAVEVISAIAGG
jgi:sulfur carrier protein ThiS